MAITITGSGHNSSITLYGIRFTHFKVIEVHVNAHVLYLLCRCIVVTQRTEKGGQQTKNDGTLQYRHKKAGLTALSHFAIACRFNMLKQNKPIRL